MAFRRVKDPDIEIDVGAFADIAFLMIIFFILTTTIVRITGRDVQIPSSEQSQEEREEKTPTIILSGDEIRYGGGEPDAPVITMEDLRLKLFDARLEEKPDDQERVVILECKADVKWELYFDVMTAVSHAGGIVAIVETEGGGQPAGGDAGASKAESNDS